MMLCSASLLWLNIEYSVLNPTVFYAGLPLPDSPREVAPSGLALHSPSTLPTNVVIYVAAVLIVGFILESLLRRIEARKKDLGGAPSE
jgi:hypothetical protein